MLLDLRRRLTDEYGDTPAAMMLIDRAVAACQDFVRITGWTGNTALMVEAEFFGRKKPSAEFQDRHGRGGREIRGLTVEEYIKRLGQDLIPLGRALRPGPARGARGVGGDPRRTEPGGRTIKARQDLGDIRTAPTGLSTRAAAA